MPNVSAFPLLVAAGCLWLTGPLALAQRNTDPFANPTVQDPFGTPAEETAPKNALTSDPFGGATAPDPFAAPPKAPALDDPTQVTNRSPRLRTWLGRASAKAEAMDKKLDQSTSYSFREESLLAVVNNLSQQHDLPIVIDQRSLEEIGESTDVPVSIDVREVSLRSALRMLLDPLDLTYQIRDEVLQVTTTATAESNLLGAIYRVDLAGLQAADARKLIVQTIQPDLWEDLGGPSTIAALTSTNPAPEVRSDLLIVHTTQRGHEQIENLLSAIAGQAAGDLSLLPSDPSPQLGSFGSPSSVLGSPSVGMQ